PRHRPRPCERGALTGRSEAHTEVRSRMIWRARLLAAWLLIIPAHASAQARARPASNHAPGFDLGRTTAITDTRIPPERALGAYLSLLREEVTSPSLPRQGFNGGAITHEYTLAQIVLAGENAK